jgi:hypothetical protein
MGSITQVYIEETKTRPLPRDIKEKTTEYLSEDVQSVIRYLNSVLPE